MPASPEVTLTTILWKELFNLPNRCFLKIATVQECHVLSGLNISTWFWNIKSKEIFFFFLFIDHEIWDFLIVCSTNIVKSRERKKNFYWWLFELPANLCQSICPPGSSCRLRLAGSSEGSRCKSFPPQLYRAKYKRLTDFIVHLYVELIFPTVNYSVFV